MKLINALILASTLVAGDAVAGTMSTGRVTLRVRTEPNGYDVSDVGRFASDPAFLGSVNPFAISADMLEDGTKIPEGLCTVRVRVAGGEILTIEARAEHPEVVRTVLDELVSNLKSIEPTTRTMARERLEAAEHELERALTVFETSQQTLRSFIEKNGAVEPGIWLQTVQKSLMDKTNQLDGADIQLAGEQALRDYLLQAISREPKQLEEPVEGLDKELMSYRSQLRMLEGELATLQAQHPDDHPDDHPLLVVAQSRIQDLVSVIEQRQSAKQVSQNPIRLDLEQDLYKLERELALDENRQRLLALSVQRLRDEARRFALLDSDWRELSKVNGAADQILRQARAEHNDALRLASQKLVGEWIRVVAGPQISTR